MDNELFEIIGVLLTFGVPALVAIVAILRGNGGTDTDCRPGFSSFDRGVCNGVVANDLDQNQSPGLVAAAGHQRSFTITWRSIGDETDDLRRHCDFLEPHISALDKHQAIFDGRPPNGVHDPKGRSIWPAFPDFH